MRSPEVLEKVYLTLRSLWYYSVWGSFYTFLAYKSTILMTVLGVLGSFLTYYFLGYSIVYQRGIVDYGVGNPLAFILSGMLLAQIANPFRYNFPLHLQSFHYAYSRPIPPVLVLVRDWVAIYTQYNAYIVLVYAAALLLSGRVAPDPLSLTAFLLLWIAMNVGLNLFENGLVYHVKKGEPISMAVRFLEYVFSGQYFLLTILPEPLKNAVWLLPTPGRTWCGVRSSSRDLES